MFFVCDTSLAPTAVSVNTRLWRFAGLTLGLLMFSSPMMPQTHRQKPDPCKDTSNMTQGATNECVAVKELHTAESGSVYSMGLAIQSLTDGRIGDLKALITSREGDVCIGYRPPGRRSN